MEFYGICAYYVRLPGPDLSQRSQKYRTGESRSGARNSSRQRAGNRATHEPAGEVAGWPEEVAGWPTGRLVSLRAGRQGWVRSGAPLRELRRGLFLSVCVGGRGAQRLPCALGLTQTGRT